MVNIILYKLYSQLYDQEYFDACLISELYFNIVYISCSS